MASTLISVAMPVYNAAPYLREAIDSILAQTRSDFELIAVNDGSTDESRDILDDYARRDGRVRPIHTPNQGVAGALNTCLQASTGRYFARMDADDRALPERFEKQVAFLEAHPDVIVLGTRVMLMEPYGSPVAVAGQKLTHEEIAAELMTNGGGWAIVHPTIMTTVDAMRRVGGYRVQWRIGEDHDLFLRLSEIGKVANLPDVLLWYRRHLQSANFTKFELIAKTKHEILKEAYQRRGQPVPEIPPYHWSPPPPAEQCRVWGWAALQAGKAAAARRHAFKALRHAPACLDAWRLMFCAVRGH